MRIQQTMCEARKAENPPQKLPVILSPLLDVVLMAIHCAAMQRCIVLLPLCVMRYWHVEWQAPVVFMQAPHLPSSQ